MLYMHASMKFIPFTRISKDFRRLFCSSFQAMLDQTAVNDLKGESFPKDFNFREVEDHI